MRASISFFEIGAFPILVFTFKGLGNIVQMRENGSKVVTSLLDVQLQIIWKLHTTPSNKTISIFVIN